MKIMVKKSTLNHAKRSAPVGPPMTSSTPFVRPSDEAIPFQLADQVTWVEGKGTKYQIGSTTVSAEQVHDALEDTYDALFAMQHMRDIGALEDARCFLLDKFEELEEIIRGDFSRRARRRRAELRRRYSEGEHS